MQSATALQPPLTPGPSPASGRGETHQSKYFVIDSSGRFFGPSPTFTA